LAFGAISDPFLAGAAWFSVAMLASVAALLATIAVLRIRLLKRIARWREATARWSPLLAECTERVPAVLPPLARREAEMFLVLWCKAQESLRGEAQQRLRQMARTLGAGPIARRMLALRRRRFRLLALVTLGHLREASVVEHLMDLIPDAPTVVSMTAAQALVRIDPALGVPRVLAATARRRDWALGEVAALLRECEPEHIGPLLSAAIRAEMRAHADDKPAFGLARLLRLHLCAHADAVRAAVLEALDGARDLEPLIAALDALFHPQDADRARRLLAHGEWEVRAAAARALGRLGGPDDFERLRAALGDRSWWVRYRAAQALCSLPQLDAQALSALPGRLTDAFAADMLRHALAERSAA